QRGDQHQGLVARTGLADHPQIVGRLQHAAQPDPHHRVVVDKHDADHVGPDGSVTRTVVPAPGTDETVAVPPYAAARLRSPGRPYPSRAVAGSKPHPSSMIAIWPSVYSIRMWAADACFRTFASASCAAR